MADTLRTGSRGRRLKDSASRTMGASAVDAGAGTAVAIFPELLTPRECAVYRRCSVRKLDRERAVGIGPAYVRIDGRILYRRADVDRFIEAHLRFGDRANSTSEGGAS